MRNLFNKTRRSFFLSKIFRNIFYLFIIFTSLPLYTYAQWIDAYIPDFKVNDDNLNSYQTNSQIGVDSAGNFVIVWYDVRAYPGNQYPPRIYCQRYNKDGLLLGNNFIIGQDTSYSPRITMLSDGRFIALWGHSFIMSIQNYELYFQRFDNNGIALDVPKRVIDTSFVAATNLLAGIDISSDSTGNFIICWCLKPNINSSPFVYFQRYDSSGSRIDTVQTVNENFGYVQYPSIASNKDGSFVIVWQDDRHPTVTAYDIFMQRYNTNGIKIGNNVKVNDDTTLQLFRGGAKVSTNGYGQAVVIWTDPRICNSGEVYYQIYDSISIPIGTNRKANNSPCGSGAGGSAVFMRDDKKFFIYWTDLNLSGREQSYGRRFDALGVPIGNQFMIPQTSPPPTNQRADGMKIMGDRVYCTWTHFEQSSNNTDIYCNVRGFQNPDTVIGIVNQTGIAGEFKLFPAYPNPFNASSKIKYQLSKLNHITIIVYDITGKVVEKLINRIQQAGEYEMIWQAENYSSGIYFIEMKTEGGYRHTQKLMLLK